MKHYGIGAYELIPGSGIFVPDIGELSAGATKGVAATTGQSLAKSAGVQQAGREAAGTAIGQKLVNFYTQSPLVAWGTTAAVAALLVYGGMEFLGKRARL